MIYILEDINKITNKMLESCDIYFSENNHQGINNKNNVTGKLLNSLGLSLLGYALNREFGIKEKPILKYGRLGKPFFSNFSGLYFNISHCKEAIACGISHHDLGVDVQDYIKYKKDVAQYCLSEKEKTQLKNTSNIDHSFTELWTLKESYGKYNGDGIMYDMTSTNFRMGKYGWYKMYELWFYTQKYERYVFSACSKNKIPILLITLTECGFEQKHTNIM